MNKTLKIILIIVVIIVILAALFLAFRTYIKANLDGEVDDITFKILSGQPTAKIKIKVKNDTFIPIKIRNIEVEIFDKDKEHIGTVKRNSLEVNPKASNSVWFDISSFTMDNVDIEDFIYMNFVGYKLDLKFNFWFAELKTEIIL